MKKKAAAFEEVQRPLVAQSTGRWQKSPIVEAILKTATNGGAVRIPLNGMDPARRTGTWRSNYRLRAVGKIRYQADGDSVLVWVEPTNGKP